MGSGPWFGLLGPLDVRLDDTPVPVRAGKHRALLAALALRAGRVVPVGELVAALWGDAPPSRTRGTLQTYVMRLRQLLGDPSLIRTTTDGYRLVVPPERVDAHRFATLAGLARRAARAGELVGAAARYEEALQLWRGPALVDVPSAALRGAEAPRLTERLMAVHEERNDVELALGNHQRLVPLLRGLTADHPLRERFWAQLMLALYRDSRQAEALEVFRRVDRALGEQLGVEPGAELRALHQAILVGDTRLAAPRSASPEQSPEQPPEQPAGQPPEQLPADVPGFVGRAELVDRITRLVAPDGARTAVPIVVLTGVAGVGKTALAVHVAHRLRDRFPDGRLHADLRGGTPTADVLTRFLRELGVPPEQVPVDVDERGGLFRSLLAGRRMLLVLDNATAPDQVRPLLPGAAGCPVLVTSREDLRGLIAVDGARRVRVDALSPDESVRLLGLSGPAAHELARRCGHLPLVLGIAAAAVGDGSAARFVERLGERTPLEVAHAGLTPRARRLFSLLDVVPGPDFTAEAAAAVAGVEVAEASAALAELTSARLLLSPAAGRFAVHDELARFAAELPDEGRAAAWARLLEFYCAAVDRCAELLYPDLPRPPFDAEQAVPPPVVGTPAQARAWLDAERVNLTAAIRVAARSGPAAAAWRLADGLRGYLSTGKHLAEWLATARYGLAAAHERHDVAGVAAMHQNLGVLRWKLGDTAAAVEHCTHAIELHRALGDVPAEAAAHGGLGLVHLESGDFTAARRALETCLALQRQVGGARAGVLLGLGLLALETGALAEASARLTEALRIGAERGRGPEAACRAALGVALRLLGEPQRALAQLDQALRISAESGSRETSARVLECTAAVHLALGEPLAALEAGHRALAELRESGDQRITTDVLVAMAEANRELGSPRAADEQHQQALTKARRIGYRSAEARALVGLAATRRALGDAVEARSLGEQAVAVATRLGARVTEGMARVELARAELALGDRRAAAAQAEEALRLQERTGHRPGAVAAAAVLARTR